jgi:hypothetical protein
VYPVSNRLPKCASASGVTGYSNRLSQELERELADLKATSTRTRKPPAGAKKPAKIHVIDSDAEENDEDEGPKISAIDSSDQQAALSTDRSEQDSSDEDAPKKRSVDDEASDEPEARQGSASKKAKTRKQTDKKATKTPATKSHDAAPAAGKRSSKKQPPKKQSPNKESPKKSNRSKASSNKAQGKTPGNNKVLGTEIAASNRLLSRSRQCPTLMDQSPLASR